MQADRGSDGIEEGGALAREAGNERAGATPPAAGAGAGAERARGEASLQGMGELLRDCFRHRPAVYWTDLTLTLAVAYPCLLYYLFAPELGPGALLAYAVAGFGMFRAGSFIHEVQHIGRGRLKAFKTVWNALVGVPFLVPSTMYENHADHHSVRRYGTPEDGEYLTLGSGPAWRIVTYFLQVPILPLLGVLRFGVLVPLSMLHPRLRRLLLERASSYGINLSYRREVPASAPHGLWALADLAGFAWVALIAGLLLSGVLSWGWLARVYAFAMFTIGLNWVRTLAAHRYRSGGAALTREEQLLDSVTVTGPPVLVDLLFPVGLRYHSLHHLFPSIPYHELGRAHRRLMAELPPDSSYRRTVYPGLGAVTAHILRDARAGARGGFEPPTPQPSV